MRQGDVFWLDAPEPAGSEPGGHRPVVVVQHDRFNRTALATTVVVAITSRLHYGDLPGNVRLRRGEAGLPRASVVNVTQVATVDRARLRGRVGTLSKKRFAEVWAGVCLGCAPDPSA